MERFDAPAAVREEVAWRRRGGTPDAVQVVRAVRWNERESCHAPLVALIGRHDPSHAHDFRSPADVERLLTQLREAMAEA